MDPVSALLALAVFAALARVIVLGVARVRAVRAPAIAAELARRELAAREGGRPETAIAVDSAAQIEPRVTRTPCPRCGGHVHVLEHAARLVEVEGSPTRLRRVLARCSPCGGDFETWFAVRDPAPD